MFKWSSKPKLYHIPGWETEDSHIGHQHSPCCRCYRHVANKLTLFPLWLSEGRLLSIHHHHLSTKFLGLLLILVLRH